MNLSQTASLLPPQHYCYHPYHIILLEIWLRAVQGIEKTFPCQNGPYFTIHTEEIETLEYGHLRCIVDPVSWTQITLEGRHNVAADTSKTAGDRGLRLPVGWERWFHCEFQSGAEAAAGWPALTSCLSSLDRLQLVDLKGSSSLWPCIRLLPSKSRQSDVGVDRVWWTSGCFPECFDLVSLASLCVLGFSACFCTRSAKLPNSMPLLLAYINIVKRCSFPSRCNYSSKRASLWYVVPLNEYLEVLYKTCKQRIPWMGMCCLTL